MEHFIRIAFGIVALGACLLQGSPVPFIEINDWNTKLDVKCNDSIFYTPTDVKVECFITALNCITAELDGTAKKECKDPRQEISRGLDTLEHVISKLTKIKHLTANNSTDCDCHRWPERPFGDLVREVRSLLQKINENV